MAHYRKDASSNRDALFGGGSKSKSAGGSKGGGGSSGKRSSAFGGSAAASHNQPPQRSAATASAAGYGVGNGSGKVGLGSTSATTDPTLTPGPSVIFASHGRIASRSNPISLLTGQAKIAKMADAEDYRLKAKKAMTRGVFSRPDPISAANFYKRAADCYKQCGENRLERLHRIAGGDCQLGQDAYATAAAEYTRAAELAEGSDETLPRKRQECHKLHLDAANAWAQMGEKGRMAESTMKAAFGLVLGEINTKPLDPKALKAVEEAIESFVGDPLNRKRDYRRTGVSVYDDADNATASKDAALELARQNIVGDSFAHETLCKAGNELVRRRHYESALYAHGAGTASLQNEGFATVSLHRAYLSECVLILAMGDAVAAKNEFQSVHLQSTSYLSSRECALEEDLVRACDGMDEEALDEAMSKSGAHRAALANLDPVLRELAKEIRVSGRAGGKKKAEKKAAAVTKRITSDKPAPLPKKAEEKAPALSGEELVQDTDVGFAEMDDIMNQMGLNGEDSDDDDIDLT